MAAAVAQAPVVQPRRRGGACTGVSIDDGAREGDMMNALERAMSGFPELLPGHVWLAGAGPGDPGLLTLHALHALGQADTVVFDALVDERVVALVRPEAEKLFAGKRGGRPSAMQTDITAQLIELAREGRRVLRLKGGDPFVFGRGGEEVLALAEQGIPFRVIPGISSGLAALTAAFIPATLRGENQAIVLATGHSADAAEVLPGDVDWAALARLAQPMVLYMAVTHMAAISGALMAAGDGGRDAGGGDRLGDDAAAACAGDDARGIVGSGGAGRAAVAGDRGDRDDRGYAGAAVVAAAAVGGGLRMGARGIVIGAPRSGSGKTTVTLALAVALRRRGLRVRVAKSGPDYIDPAFHAAATGAACLNLDSWAMSPGELDAILGGLAAEADLVLIETSMGLFDGVDAPVGRSGAGAELAARYGLPVVLVLDVSGQSQSAAAVARGFAGHRDGVRVTGVVLNRVGSERHRAQAAGAMAGVPMPVLGSVGRSAAIALPERHLGLVQAGEHGDLERLFDALGALGESLDLTAILAAAAPISLDVGVGVGVRPPGQTVALAQDRAFSFFYGHLAEAWRRAGAEIVPFSPLADEAPRDDCDACWLPGGYPELHAGALAAAGQFRDGMVRFAATRPVHGECGGHMVLGAALEDARGWSMRCWGCCRIGRALRSASCIWGIGRRGC